MKSSEWDPVSCKKGLGDLQEKRKKKKVNSRIQKCLAPRKKTELSLAQHKVQNSQMYCKSTTGF